MQLPEENVEAMASVVQVAGATMGRQQGERVMEQEEGWAKAIPAEFNSQGIKHSQLVNEKKESQPGSRQQIYKRERKIKTVLIF
jgi:hypothetical protein